MTPHVGTKARPQDVAIVGIACRFAGAPDREQFWLNIDRGVESVVALSDDELRAAGVTEEQISDERYVKAAACIDDIDAFDAGFFGVTRREAEMLDPQHRVMLETAWHALEDAGYDPAVFPGWIGVFAGTGKNTYLIHHLERGVTRSRVDPFQLLLASEKDYLCTRLSYKLNLRGPSIGIQSACSTSLVAVHLACHSLRSHQCDIALAGGVNVQVPHRAGYVAEDSSYLSPDGHCRAFDANGRGTVIANGGVGVVVLRRLADAIADRDFIYAVIRGSAVNNDGSEKIGFTAPSIDGQAAAVRLALEVAAVDPATVSYIETHGTGTQLGDPIEVAALRAAFADGHRAAGTRCALGSVKANIGHAGTAAGIAGVIKAALALTHRVLPPAVNYERPNPAIDFSSGPFYVNVERREWSNTGGPRRAGVSSFGIGGTNAHAVLEEAPAATADAAARPWQVLTWSARTSAECDRAVAGTCEYLDRHREISLADAAHTLHVGRRSFAHRAAIVCGTNAGPRPAADSRSPRTTAAAPADGRRVAFVFPGGGAQAVGMGRELYEEETVYRTAVDQCSALLGPHLGSDVRTLMFDTPAGDGLERPRFGLPTLFVTEYALAQLWLASGVTPDAMLGHSVGEYVAACLAGVLPLAEALRLVAYRGELFESLSPGAMLSVSLGEREIREQLHAGLWLAAINSPKQCVVAGETEAVSELMNRLTADGIEARRVPIAVAAHSGLVEPILGPFEAALAGVRLQPPAIPYVSNLTGDWVTAEQVASPRYWSQHLRSTVKFSDGIACISEAGDWAFLEVGPGQTLSALVRQHQELRKGIVAVSSMRHRFDAEPDGQVFATALAQLWTAGAHVDWHVYHQTERRCRVPLPGYPFARDRYWLATDHSLQPREQGTRDHDRVPGVERWFHVPYWKPSAPLATLSPTPGEQWLVFADDAPIAEAFIGFLKREGANASAVRRSTTFERRAPDEYGVPPGSAEDIARLFTEMRLEGRSPAHIAYLWPVTDARQAPPDDELIDRGFYGLVNLARALVIAGVSTASVAVVSSDAFRVKGSEHVQPLKATLLGPCRILPLELPGIRCRHVDISASDSFGNPELSQLYTECRAAPAGGSTAIRSRQRWIRAFERTPLKPGPSVVAKGDVILITGGLGGVGLALADYLSRTFQARLVLTARAPLPPPAEWTAVLSALKSDPRADDAAAMTTRHRFEALCRMASSGADVEVVSADVSRVDHVRALTRDIVQRHGRLDGIIHCAMATGGGLIELEAASRARDEFGPKIGGALALESMLAELSPRFFVLCSSLSAIEARVGLAAYTATNTFVEALAESCDKAYPNTHTVAIGWPRWSAVGSAVSFEQMHKRLTGDDLEGGVGVEQATEAFGRILSHRAGPVVFLSPRDGDVASSIGRAHVVEAGSDVLIREHGQSASPDATDTETAVRDIWIEVLGDPTLGLEQSFAALGGDSLMAVRVVSRIRQRFGVTMPVRTLFEHSTIRALSAVIDMGRPQPSDADEPRPNAAAEVIEGVI